MRRALPFALLLLVACGRAPEQPRTATADPAPKPEEPKTAPIQIGPGAATQYSPDAKRESLWDVRWEEANARPGKSGSAIVGERMSGTIYDDGKPVADYVGDAGFADQKEKLLLLKGNVRVTSKKYEATILCDELRYEGGRKRVRARGNVRITGRAGNLASQSEVWASPDLTKIGTPSLFDSL